MIVKRAMLYTCGVWELIRLPLIITIGTLLLNPDGDFVAIIVLLIMNGGSFIIPLLIFYPAISPKFDPEGISIKYVRIIKIWSIIWEGILALLPSSAGFFLIAVFEYLSGSNAVYRFFSGGFLQQLPKNVISMIFFVDLIFLVVILLYKSGSSENSRSGKGVNLLPKAEVVSIDTEEDV